MASDGANITGLWFDGQKYFAAGLPECHTEKYLSVFGQTGQWLDIYFSGKAPDFMPPLSMHGISSFRKRVWEILLAIPFGQVTSYGKIAAQMAGETGKPVSAQAVGGAVGHNAISLIIPCHRVVGGRLSYRLCRRDKQKTCASEIGRRCYTKFIPAQETNGEARISKHGRQIFTACHPPPEASGSLQNSTP